MMKWLDEYNLLSNWTRPFAVCGFLVTAGLIIREFFALHVDITLYELPTLPNEVWWEVFVSVILAVSILSVLVLRTGIILRNGYSGLTSALTIVATVLFLGYAFSTQPASTDSICDSSGRCFGIYTFQRQDWVDLAGLLYLPGTLVRSFLTFVMAIVSGRFKFE